MVHVGSKTRSLGQNLEKPCIRSRGHIFSPIILKLGHNVCLDRISDEFKNGSCEVKTRSQGQILQKPCVHSRGLIFSPIIKKLGQNVRLDEISDNFENGSCWFKNQVTRSNLKITVRKVQVSDSGTILAFLSYIYAFNFGNAKILSCQKVELANSSLLVHNKL